MNAVEDVMKQMPAGIGYEWTGASLQERISGAQAPLLYAISILFVFLCLAALYESWSVPFSVILVVPLGIVGALLFTWTRGLSNDVYFQVGLLTTVGLSSKNAILIVEFAKQLQEQGKSVLEATLQAVRLRLRPILMTSLAFGFGVLPLAIGTGAGAGGRQSIGTAVLGGMVVGTALGIFFVPLFFVLIRGFMERRRKQARTTGATVPAHRAKGATEPHASGFRGAVALSLSARPCCWPAASTWRPATATGRAGARRLGRPPVFRPEARAPARHRLARLLPRRAPAPRGRAHARQQPRPARVRAQHRTCARAVRRRPRRAFPSIGWAPAAAAAARRARRVGAAASRVSSQVQRRPRA
jgi:uncharacterized membrane protein